MGSSRSSAEVSGMPSANAPSYGIDSAFCKAAIAGAFATATGLCVPLANSQSAEKFLKQVLDWFEKQDARQQGPSLGNPGKLCLAPLHHELAENNELDTYTHINIHIATKWRDRDTLENTTPERAFEDPLLSLMLKVWASSLF
jgi:hypothetical protein